MYKNLNNCLCCDSDKLKIVLDLNEQPLANSYHNGEKEEIKFPLCLNLCEECFHLQLSVSVDPDLMFKNYLYVSGTSRTMNEHFKDFAKKIYERNENAKTVLDIACNDGSQLDFFSELGLETYGVDPAENLHNISMSKGHKVYCQYFDNDFAKNINKKFDLIVAQNVFAHNDNPLQFLTLAKDILSDDGAIYIQTSQANMIKNNEFDTIYHEHISFFNVNSIKTLIEKSGLHLIDVYLEKIHGTSYVFEIAKKTNRKTINVTKKWCEEDKFGIYNIETYKKYADACNKVVVDLKNKIDELKEQGYIIIGYGAAAKGTVLLNYSKIKLDFVVDDNPMKHYLTIPGTNTVIFPPWSLKEYFDDKIVIVPLAWNFFEEIKNNTIKIMDKTKIPFLKYFPEVSVDL